MQKLGRYDLIRVLGKGAMGLVYEGRDPNLDRRVAIKTIRVENLSAEEAADYEVRFRTEARSAARLQHPHIVTVFDSDRDGDVAFLVMEFIDGEDLKQHLDRGEVYTLAQTLGIMGDLLSAMDYAHRQGIVHRDIKPANLLMEPSGRLKLTDFGVARIQDSGDATRTQGTMVGTLKYMSPEQVQGRAIDSRSDLFAAGVVLYQLLTSRRPFDGVTDFDVIQNIVSNPPVLPSVITPGLPLELDAVVFRALEKSRDNRYASAQEFHTALVAAVHTGSDQTISPQARPQNKRTAAATLGSGSPPFTAPTESSSGSTSSVVTQEVELVYWKDIKDSSEADDFEEFLRKFPKGIYADLARRKLKRLGTLSNGADTDTGYGATMVIPRAQPAAPAFAGSDEATLVAMPPQSAREAEVAVPDTVLEPQAEAETKTETETEAKAEAKAEASAAIKPRWSAKVLGFAGAGVLALGGVIYGLGAGSAAPDSTQPITPMPAASQAAVAVSAPASAPASAPIAAVSAASAASAPLPASSVPALPASKPKPTVRASAPLAPAVIPASKSSALKALAPNPVSKDAPESSSTQAPVTPAPSPAKTNNPVDPRTTCEGRWLVSYQICMSMECRKPELAQFPICIERREQERSNLERATKGH